MKPFLNDRLTEVLKGAQRVFLCTHISPDGDAVGSLLALKLLLEGMGKTVAACCADPVPKQYRLLPGAADVIVPDQAAGSFDASLSVDAADEKRLGNAFAVWQQAPVRLQIDHHGTNPLFADENEVDAVAPAAGCIVARLIRRLDQSLTPEIATCLYAAISTDTGNFSYPNVDTETFEIMADLRSTGFDFGFWARQLHLMREPEYLGMLARALSTLTFSHDGKVTTMQVGPRDYAEVGALPEHCENIVNYGMYIPGVALCCFVNGTAENVTKFSIRALPPYSAQNVAVRLGGGGHVAAAGATVKLPVDQAIPGLMQAIDEEMDSHS